MAHARLALTCEIEGDTKDTPDGIDHSDDRASDAGREPRGDGIWVSFCAGVKTESSQTAAAVPAFPSRPSFSQGILARLGELPTSEVRGLRLESFLRQHLLPRARRRAVGYQLLLL